MFKPSAAGVTPPWKWITELFRSSGKSQAERKVGIEIERIGMWPDGTPLRYRESMEKGRRYPGAQQLLAEMDQRHGWPPIRNDQGTPLGFASPYGKVSLEPGSQLELSSDPARDLFSVIDLVRGFERLVDEITDPWGMKWIGIGVNPFHQVPDIDVIPSTRYHIMTDYLGQRASLGTTMMRLTSSVQINLDYDTEESAIDMFRIALAAAPLSYALFGNSPFSRGAETGYLSYRNHVWTKTDPDRTGLVPEVFRPGFNFDRYAELAWHRPLMFAQDVDGHYVAAEGASLVDIAADKVPNVAADETNQLNSIRELFFEARLKPGYIEIRSVDGVRPADRYAASAFWMGLLYGEEARRVARESLVSLTTEERETLQAASAREGLAAKAGKLTLLEIAGRLLPAIRDELQRRGFGEESLLRPVEARLETGLNPAQELLAEWKGPMRGQAPELVHYLALEG